MENKTKFAGWHIVFVIAVLIGVFVVRPMTFNDNKNDKSLMSNIAGQLIIDFSPDDIAKSAMRTKLNIESVKSSYPLFNLFTPKEAVIKIKYSRINDSGKKENGTKYYLFSQDSLDGSWHYKWETGVERYYLNFL